MDGSTPLKPSRVLRAADVIPPFENDSASSNNPASRDPIPTFDLAESILAEQRRLASGKRKRTRDAAGQGMGGPAHGCMGEAVTFSSAHPAPVQLYDLAELHQIVAGIVSRDIELLCTGPAVAL
jgi:hypothetical protein